MKVNRSELNQRGTAKSVCDWVFMYFSFFALSSSFLQTYNSTHVNHNAWKGDGIYHFSFNNFLQCRKTEYNSKQDKAVLWKKTEKRTLRVDGGRTTSTVKDGKRRVGAGGAGGVLEEAFVLQVDKAFSGQSIYSPQTGMLWAVPRRLRCSMGINKPVWHLHSVSRHCQRRVPPQRPRPAMSPI